MSEEKLIEVEKMKQALKDKDEQIDRIVIDGALRVAALKAGLRQIAVEDAVIRGRSMFVRDEYGNPVAMGKDGKSALGPSEWLESMEDKAAHWWPPSTGGELEVLKRIRKEIKHDADRNLDNEYMQGLLAGIDMAMDTLEDRLPAVKKWD